MDDFVNAAEEGVIVFALGGMLDTDADALSIRFIEAFFQVFRDLPRLNVVWKLKLPDHLLKNKPANVKLVDWMPQQDLLGHPKTRLFISHGGIQSSFESVCHGKPMLGIGLFGDQSFNLKVLAKKGMALLADFKDINATRVKRQIAELLYDSKYAESAAMARSIFSDQPQTPAQKLRWSVAYALRHQGARHLTSQAALNLYWFQYYLLDVALFLGVVASTLVGLCCWCVRRCCRGHFVKTKVE